MAQFYLGVRGSRQASAVGAAEFSPVRKGWEKFPKRPSAVGATQLLASWSTGGGWRTLPRGNGLNPIRLKPAGRRILSAVCAERVRVLTLDEHPKFFAGVAFHSECISKE